VLPDERMGRDRREHVFPSASEEVSGTRRSAVEISGLLWPWRQRTAVRCSGNTFLP
jgi:hypothetical protein